LIGISTGSISVILAIYLFVTHSYNFSLLFDFIVLGIFLYLAPTGIQDIYERKRTKAIESRLPDFLRDVAEASKFGSNLADSIIAASDGQYGVLSVEIKKMAAQIRWGVSVDEVLEEFVKRNKSPFTEKLMLTVMEANRSGGNTSEVLNLIAVNSREAQVLTKEKYSQLSSYIIIIVIAYAVFLLTVLVLDVQFFPQMTKQIASGTSASSFAFLNLSTIPLIKEILTGVGIVQGVGSGLMSGVLGEGRYQSGLLYAAILASIGYILIVSLGGV
jgi:flagellar protein FlaJ